MSQVVSKVLCTQEDWKEQRDIIHDIVNHLLDTFPAKDIVSINIEHKIIEDNVEIVGTITYKEKRNA